MITFDAQNFGFVLSLPEGRQLPFSVHAELDGNAVEFSPWEPSLTEAGTFCSASRCGEWTLRSRCGANGGIALTLEAALSPDAQPVSRAVLTPFCLEALEVGHVLTHGRTMGGCESYPCEDDTASVIESAFFLCATLGKAGEKTILFSHPLHQGHFSHFSGRLEGRSLVGLKASTECDPAGGPLLRSAAVTIDAGDGHALLEGWAKVEAADREPVPIPQDSGWNSWDYYRWTITEDEVLRNAEFIAADPVLSQHINRIVVDDGWQYCYGEWNANSLFPSGMDSLAAKIRKMGFVPGLWFAPTLVEPHARIAQLNSEMLAMAPSGLPCLAFSCMRRNTFLADPTRPKVKDWWRQLFRRYAGYGYRYFKIDFLAATLEAPCFSEPVPKGELMRHILEPIRDAVGPESRILGCSYQFQGGRDLVNEARISGDIHADWESVKMNVTSIAARYWAHGRFWINDPDFAVCRGEETSGDPDLHRLKPLLVFVQPGDTEPQHFNSSLVDLNRRQAEVLLSLVITSGGAMNLSDNLPRLNPTGLQLLRKAVAARKGEAAVPLDLFRSRYPAYWAQRLSGGLHRLLIINWGDSRRDYEIDLSRLNFPASTPSNFWTGEPVPAPGRILSTTLEPHSCLLVEMA